MKLIGPSELNTSPIKFREPFKLGKPDAKNQYPAGCLQWYQAEFENALNFTDLSLRCIKETPLPVGSKLTVQLRDLMQNTTVGPLPANSVFSSVHGMVAAMEWYGIGREGIPFEIALGARTTKVSSCVPCSIYMASRGAPASSIHLGRGDNWVLKSGSANYATWRNYVISCYNQGKQMVGALPVVQNAEVKRLFEHENVIPEVFLEALTFMGSFTGKLTRALSLHA